MRLRNHAKLLAVLLKEDPAQRFGEHVGHHVFGGDVDQTYRLLLNAVLDEVVPCVNMLCSSVVFRIFCKSLCAFIVDMDGYCAFGSQRKFQEKMFEP